uniref:Leukocyte elastase inhibitor n=1 Tax=Hadrurus spadix TaxID=141984 RepID=A0A1W7RAM3_9SCOR
MIHTLAFLAAAVITVYAYQANVCTNEDVRVFARVNNKFGKDLLRLSNSEGNIFFSPSSLTSALSAIYFGANGKTARDLTVLRYLSMQYQNVSSINPVLTYCLELLRTLKSTSRDYTLERANAALVQEGYTILQEYKDRLHESFGTIVKNIDFEEQNEKAVEEINQWVTEKTHGKISKLVDNLDEATKFLLLSAIYFKGTWQTKFDPENTESRPFYNNGKNSPKSVLTMKLNTKFPYLYDPVNEYRALQLPYKGNSISMIIVLPFERDGIEKLQQSITSETLIDILERVRETQVTVFLPKFNIIHSMSLKDDLISAGLGSMFSTNADFSRITGNKGLYVSDIIHKAVVEVNEEGSEAAAVTGAIFFPTSLEIPYDRNIFKADHPFLFFIIDNRSGSNLFIGRVTKL